NFVYDPWMRRAIHRSVRTDDEGGNRESSIFRGVACEVMEHCQNSRRRDSEDVSKSERPALLRRSIKISIQPQQQAAQRSAAMNRVETEKLRVSAAGRDLENRADVVRATE